MQSEVQTLLARLQHLALNDPAAQQELAALGGHVDPGALGLHDVMLGGWYNEETGELTPGFQVGPEDIVADVGCGDGGALNFCAKRGPHVILADIDADRIARATAWIESSAARKVESYVTDGSPLPLASASVTRVICMEVLEHVDDPAAFMDELVRVGMPGARYLLTVPDVTQEKLQKHLAPETYFQKPNHVRIFEREAFDALVRDAGLTIERRSYYGFFWAMWWLMFWTCDVKFEGGVRHPVLDNWARTWSSVLASKDGLRIKHLMDRFMPKNQVIVASKPGSASRSDT
jgi:ubiquinone/menaquinone biosynthesis C-methylase UbiE